MMKSIAVLFIGAVFVVAACSSDTIDSATTAGGSVVAAGPTEEDLPVILTVMPTVQPTKAGYVGEIYTEFELRDVRTGETFTLADFAGKTVFVHPMATWCIECTESQQRLRDGVVSAVDGERVTFVSLSIEATISEDELARYAEDHRFDWIFAVAPSAMLSKLIEDFGRSVVAPVMSPHFIIGPDGSASPLYMGYTLPAQNIERIRARSSS